MPSGASIRRTIEGGSLPGNISWSRTSVPGGSATRLRIEEGPSERMTQTSRRTGADSRNGWVHRQLLQRAIPSTPPAEAAATRRILWGVSSPQTSQGIVAERIAGVGVFARFGTLGFAMGIVAVPPTPE
ncbi:MAG: hypothetical protein L3K08_02430 [Thermoplasmata archaeon]|nr:hypothetical protein [Thermoplasmata archaeon]